MLSSVHRTLLAEKNVIALGLGVLIALNGAFIASGVSTLQSVPKQKKIYVSSHIGNGVKTSAEREQLRHIYEKSYRIVTDVRNISPLRVPAFSFGMIYNAYPGEPRRKIADNLIEMSDGVVRRSLSLKSILSEPSVSSDLVFSVLSTSIFFDYKINRPIAKEVLRLHLKWFIDKKGYLWIKDYYYEEVEAYHAL